MTLYISVLRLDRAAVKALQITDLYSLHRIVYDLFDDVRSDTEKQTSIPSGIQWADKGGNSHYRQILLMSDRRPKIKKYGEIESRQLPMGFLDHRSYRFTVTLSPTRRDRQSRQLKPIRGKEAILSWFIERAPVNWGFCVESHCLQVDSILVQRFKAKAGRLVTLQQVTLSGYLTVIEPELFIHSFASGLGRSRAFGCGLLQVSPLTVSPFFV